MDQKQTASSSVSQQASSNKDLRSRLHLPKVFPWLQTGIFLLGFVSGLFTATVIDLSARIVPKTKTTQTALSDEEKCRKDGGRYDTDAKSCIMTTSDTGNGCKSNKDCDGWCMASESDKIGTEKEGICSTEFAVNGCFKFIDNGKVNSICMP
jgi:hypothetical protein